MQALSWIIIVVALHSLLHHHLHLLLLTLTHIVLLQ
jgi:hypothetical protein